MRPLHFSGPFLGAISLAQFLARSWQPALALFCPSALVTVVAGGNPLVAGGNPLVVGGNPLVAAAIGH
jgi:hypothetical protein